MQKRKETLMSIKLCRFCLTQDHSLCSIYDGSQTPLNSINLPLKILSAVNIEVFPSDKMPIYICNRCKMFMSICFEYKNICRKADEKILQFIHKGSSLEGLPWPSTLSKYFEQTPQKKSKGANSGKTLLQTIVEGGATVQVTPQDMSDESDEGEDGDVYNIKIGDGSDDAIKTQCIKAVAANSDSRQTTKQKPNQDKEFTSMTKLKRHLKGHAGLRPFPCKYCNKSFMKSHHYTRHLRVKHRQTVKSSRGPFGETEQYRCEQCDDVFESQDELIYHSAIHATQNLTCPLCQEKFEDVDAVTAHIKSHVTGVEFMCDLCELVFTSKEKLDNHITIAHEEELRQEQEMTLDESSMEIDADDDEDDDSIQVKEENGQMVVEVKKPENYMLKNEDSEDKNNTEGAMTGEYSESETENTYTEMANVDALAVMTKVVSKSSQRPASKGTGAGMTAKTSAAAIGNRSASIVQRAEEIKRKAIQSSANDAGNKKHNKTLDGSTGGNDKSLRLLEKELQDLKRTNSRGDTGKTEKKPLENMKGKRPQIQTSTPKPKMEEKKLLNNTKSPAVEKKQPERRAVKENKEPKEVKETKSNNNSIKEDKETKPVVKNGPNEKSLTEEGSVRRSSRPCKKKDYAKMIRENEADAEEDSEDDDDEYIEEDDKSIEDKPLRQRARRVVKSTPKSGAVASAPATPATPASTPIRKRGRPRKDPVKTEVPLKVKKENEDKESDDESQLMTDKSDDMTKQTTQLPMKQDNVEPIAADVSDIVMKTESPEKLPGNTMMSPSGQTLKKVPIKALPPGIKPMPLPVTPRSLNSTGGLCEMQIGKKVVKVQKIVMTKAEVEAMAKKGLVEMKDGTMVLKQGIKLPTNSDVQAIRSTLVGEGEAVKKSMPPKPTRYEIDDEGSAN